MICMIDQRLICWQTITNKKVVKELDFNRYEKCLTVILLMVDLLSCWKHSFVCMLWKNTYLKQVKRHATKEKYQVLFLFLPFLHWFYFFTQENHVTLQNHHHQDVNVSSYEWNTWFKTNTVSTAVGKFELTLCKSFMDLAIYLKKSNQRRFAICVFLWKRITVHRKTTFYFEKIYAASKQNIKLLGGSPTNILNHCVFSE